MICWSRLAFWSVLSGSGSGSGRVVVSMSWSIGESKLDCLLDWVGCAVV